MAVVLSQGFIRGVNSSRHRLIAIRQPLKLKPASCVPLKSRRELATCRASVTQEIGYDLYQLLGVARTASQEEIRRSYRWLQKKCHPDIAGSVGHDMSILLNEAYTTLADPNQRAAYDQGLADSMEFEGFTGLPLYSKWFGHPHEDKAVFVDESQCVGCLKCALIASSTFAIESRYGRARAVGQWADPEPAIKVAIRACPVDCISWVDRSKLAALEFVMSKEPRVPVGIDVHSNGGVRATNVFKTAESLLEKIRQREQKKASTLKETPAQRKARLTAMEGIQARAGRWWYHFVGNGGARHQARADIGRAAHQAIVPLSYYKTMKISGSGSRHDREEAYYDQASAFQSELEKLLEDAASQHRRTSVSNDVQAIDDEYWIPLARISCPVSYSVNTNSSLVLEDNQTEKGNLYKWRTSGSWLDKNLNIWVQVMPIMFSAMAALHVGLKGRTVAVASDLEILGPLPTEWTNSIEMQVLLAAAVWYMIGAGLNYVIVLAIRLFHARDEKTNAS